MLNLKRAIDDKGHVLLEMPTGTGKTVCLVSLITSYQFQFPQTGKLIYCTRTVPEMVKCMEEIKRVIAYRVKILGAEGGKVLALCLSSRRNMCIHPTVLEEGDRDTVDSLCRNMTASWVRAKALGTNNNNNNSNSNSNVNNQSRGGGLGYSNAPSTGGGNTNSGGNSSSNSNSSSAMNVAADPAINAAVAAARDQGAGGFELCNFYENYSRDGSNAGELSIKRELNGFV